MKLKARQMEFCKYKLGLQHCFVVDCKGHSGGIAMLWKDEIKFYVLNFLKYHIHAKICVDDVNKMEWFITGVYGHVDTNHIIETWNLI